MPNDNNTEDEKLKVQKSKFNYNKLIRIICALGFVIFSALFIDDVFIQPLRMNKVVDMTRDLYLPSVTPTSVGTNAPQVTAAPNLTSVPNVDSNRDEYGILLKFSDLLQKNEDTKGWITFPDTNIDYVVMQNSEDRDFYLTHDFMKEKQKAGCLFLDANSSVEENTKNLLIFGHNMKSTNNMFHALEHMKKLEYLKTHTVFSFDTLYQIGQWKIFSIFITPGSDEKEPFFDFTRSRFDNDSDYLNFIYQLRNRSIFNFNSVDINENDQIVTLCTCTYEINDYRLVICARKVREGESPTVVAKSIKKNSHPLYPELYYKIYGGKAPKLPNTFEEANRKGLIHWYKRDNTSK